MPPFEAAFVRLDQYIGQQMRQTNTPGLSVALTDREKSLRISCYGYADAATRKTVTPQTLFETGSIGKSFTSAALLGLAEAGIIDLGAPVQQCLPWFEVQTQYAPITLHHLMSHTAGIITGTDFTGEPRFETWALRETETGAPPGEYFHYSNVGYKALGLVLENALKQPYGDIIQERILKPLGMNSTAPVITSNLLDHLATGYMPLYDDRPAPADRPLIPAPRLETNTADGCLASTPGDMAIYARMLLNRGREGVLSSKGFEKLRSRVIQTSDDEDRWYGYGLVSQPIGGFDHISHTGGMVGYWSAMLCDMDNGFGIIVLTNGPYLDTVKLADYALKLLRAAQLDEELPDLPPVNDPWQIENAADYAGEYRSGDDTLHLTAEDGYLLLHTGDEPIPLAPRLSDTFYVQHPAFDHFLLRFGRENGQVVEAFYGPVHYLREGYSPNSRFDYPTQWNAYVGHYRSYNPWHTNFRIFIRKGRLIYSAGVEETPLVPLADGVFRPDDDPRSPERVCFDTIVDGQALRAFFSTCPFYRTFTP
jgi:CubicO group peptidase (beta-lactamase class C family)